jgi:histidinol phosphatase-like enzyme
LFIIGYRMMDVALAHNEGAKAVLVSESGDKYDVDL